LTAVEKSIFNCKIYHWHFLYSHTL